MDIIVDYLNFCKGKYNQVVHVSEEALKYYLYLSFFDKTESKFKELFSLIKNEKENKSMDSKKNNNAELNSQNILGEEEKENKQDGKDESEINSKYSRPLKINIDIALENFVKDNLIENDDLQLKKKLEVLESKKNSLIDKYFSNISEGWKTLLNDYDKFDKEEQENYISAFNLSEKELINEIIKDFEDSLKSLKNNLLKLKETEDETEKKELLGQFFSKYHQITEKELAFNKSYYLKLCENIQERYLLIFLQIQLTKYQMLDSYSKSFAKILNDNFESNKKLIIDEYSKLKEEIC